MGFEADLAVKVHLALGLKAKLAVQVKHLALGFEADLAVKVKC